MKVILGQCKKQSERVINSLETSEISNLIELCNSPLGDFPSAVALAHCQVEHEKPKRFFVFANGEVIINPKIIKRDNKFKHTEGCMSFPFRNTKKVPRFKNIVVTYNKKNGEEVTESKEGLVACIFQHEIDHMNGRSIFS